MPQRLAQHLIARGLLPARVVDEALRRLGREGGTLDTVLLEAGAVSEAGILQAISDVSGVRLVNLADFEPNTEAGPLMPLKMAKQLNVVPLSVDGNALHLACAYPLQPSQLKDVGFLLGKKLELWVSLECRVRDWQQALYGEPLEPRYAKLLAQLDPSRQAVAPAPAKPTIDDSVSPDVLDRIAKGIVEEPLLLTQPKPKASRAKPKIEVLDEAPRLGDEGDPPTSVIEITAYERFAKSGHEETAAAPPLDEHSHTRVMDLGQYGAFAKQVSTAAEATEAPRPSAPTPPPKISFPGGVLPPRRDAPPPRKTTGPVSFVQPAQPPRPSAERVVPPVSKRDAPVITSAPAQPVTDTSRDVTVRVAAPPEARPLSRPETSFSLPKPGSDAFSEAAAQLERGAPEAARRFSGLESTAPDVGARLENEVEPLQVADAPDAAPTPPDHSHVADAPPPAPLPRDELDFSEVNEVVSATPPPVPFVPPEPPNQLVARAPAAPRDDINTAPPPAIDFGQSGILQAPPGLAASTATEWSLAQARAALKTAVSDRDALINVVLEYARRTFEYVGAFAVMRGAAVGWDARGEGELAAIRQLAIPLDAASVFRTVSLTRGSYVGPLPPDALSQHYLALLGRMPRTVFVWPVEVQSRLVAIIYGDCGARPISQRRLADFILFCQDLPSAFHELILYRKQNPRVPQHLTSAEGLLPSTEATASEGSGQAPTDADWFNGLITLLTGPDAAERSMAMMELMKTPDASAQALAQAFPGPTGWSRLPVVELPEPDELGPVPGALARLGQPAAVAVAPLLDSSDSDTRYLALLTAGSLKYPEVVDGVLRGLFDFEPDLSSAARAAAAALRYLPHFVNRLPALRQELASSDSLRRSLAARAVGGLHDRDSVEALINLAGSDDDLCATSAGDALKEITRAGFGTNASGWTQWWAGRRDKRRIEWLVEALDADDFDLRLAAIEELSRTFGDNFGYFADGPERERESALARWKNVITSRPDLEV